MSHVMMGHAAMTNFTKWGVQAAASGEQSGRHQQ